MQSVVEDVKTVACTEANVLLTGESGTGKEVIAELIHSLSPRRDEVLLKMNCASIPETLLESQLFGHMAGAFTDARKSRTGMFELASNGTLFLDEIGDMSIATQPKILRVLQNGEIHPLGSEKIIKVNPRIIAATNRDLREMIDAGEFREDLYFRLSVVSLHLPPLRERKEDILVLTASFIEQFSDLHGKTVTGICDEVKSIFLTHSWPGNVRELKNCIERAVIFAKGTKIQVENLPSQYKQFEHTITESVLDNIVNMLTREQIAHALEKTGGVKYRAAELLNISRKTLYSRMKNLGME
jgi:two-component system, NtrC family, response regulator AtoC